MKTAFICFLLVISAFKQSDTPKIPSVTIRTLNGLSFNTEKISNDGKPIIISFWATWCKSSINQYDNISESYAGWQKETSVKLVSISLDDSKTSAKVAMMTKTRGWEFEFYLDPNQDFKRAMNVSNCPHTFLVDGQGNIVWQQSSYLEGSEDELYELIKKVANGQKIDKQ